jgi:hypothetical protein
MDRTCSDFDAKEKAFYLHALPYFRHEVEPRIGVLVSTGMAALIGASATKPSVLTLSQHRRAAARCCGDDLSALSQVAE